MMGLNILAYFIAGLIVFIVLINILGAIRPAHKPQQRVAAQTIKPKATQINSTLDADLCRQYPLIDTAYKNGYRFVNYDPLIMELRD